jgi:CRP/FNR family transcriptional regulator, dissimilatory nitrate respiration regulator
MELLSDLLETLPVFSKLSPADRFEALRLARRRVFDRGAFIFQQGDLWPKVAYFTSGQAHLVMVSQDGKRQLVFKVMGKEMFWGHTLFDDQPMPASLEVKEACELYLWSKDTLGPVLSRHPEALWDLIRLQGQTMRRAREIIYGFAFHPAAGRLARLLVSHYPQQDGKATPRDLTLDDMAAVVGTTRELICKLLYRFAEDGMLSLTRTEFVFTDRSKLEALAGQN